MKSGVTLLFLSLFINAYAQETALPDSVANMRRPVTSAAAGLHFQEPVSPGVQMAFQYFLYNQSKESTLSDHFSPDSWLMSAVGADLDPLIRRPQSFSLFDKGKWEVEWEVFARKDYVIAPIRSFVYMTGINSVYDDRFILNVRASYGHDYIEYYAPSFTIGYRYNPFTFFLNHTRIISLSKDALRSEENMLDPDVLDGTKVGVNVQVNDHIQIDAFKPLKRSEKAIFGVKIGW